MIKVSVIVPCYNEEATIRQLLTAIKNQSYPTGDIEVIIADGLSTDHTRRVIHTFQEEHTDLSIAVVDNPDRAIPFGLNLAIKAARGDTIIRMDAHSIPDRDYIANCLKCLDAGLGDNVGGIWNIRPGSDSWIARAIAEAGSTPLAVGDALYRIGGTSQAVDTVPFGAFRRELIDRIGMFDETLLTNEDYEFNARIRQAGGKVWMDPSIQSVYFARSTLPELARQYWRYGYWKAQMLCRYPRTLRWRQLIPPMFILSLLGLAALSTFWLLARWLLLGIVILYTLVLGISGIWSGIRHKDFTMIMGLPLAIATIHFSWGTAVLWGLLQKPGVHKLS